VTPDELFVNERMLMSIDEWLMFERLLCECDALCVCGWDMPEEAA
jgi:hypothetical protein